MLSQLREVELVAAINAGSLEKIQKVETELSAAQLALDGAFQALARADKSLQEHRLLLESEKGPES